MKEGSTRWAVAVAAAIFVLGAAQPRATEKPAFDSAGYPSQYAGPGREEAEPERLDEIRIGYFGPSETDDAGVPVTESDDSRRPRFRPEGLTSMIEQHVPVFEEYERTGRVARPPVW